MKTIKFILSVLIFTIFVACNKNNITSPAPTDFVGTWTISKIYGNDVWGGAYYWKDADGKTKIEFTTDGKYFRKYSTDSSYTLIGAYQKPTDSTIVITPVSINGASVYPYTLFYNFESGGYMTWGNFSTEVVVKEKYKKD